MKIGVRFVDHLGTPGELVELAVAADRLGFHSVVFPHDTFRYHGWVLAAAVAQATRQIQIMPEGTNPWSTHPSDIATLAATLDHVSRGRAILGLGLHTDQLLKWAGIEVERAAIVPAIRETAEAIRAVWRGEAAPCRGDHVRWPDTAFLRFRPFRPAVPLYVCPFGPELLELSGAIGDGSLPMCTPPQSARLMCDHVRRGARAAGRDPAALDLVGFVWVSCAADGRAARNQMAEIVAFYGPYLEAEPLATIGLTPADFDPIRQRMARGDRTGAAALVTDPMLQLGMFGTPRDVVRQMEPLISGGVTHVSLGGPLGPDPHAALELLGTEVLPHFAG